MTLGVWLLRGWSKIPVIMLSVHDEEKTEVMALNAGTDDYLTKPFGMEELNAQNQTVRRRAVTELGTSPKSGNTGQSAAYEYD